MSRNLWRSSLPHCPDNAKFVSWLREPGSLTRRLQACCAVFRVRLQHQGYQLPLRAEIAAGMPANKMMVREVVLHCDEQPVVFAHTVLNTARRGRLSLWLGRLGSRSLGSLLFSHPGFIRGRIEYCRLDARDELYRRAAHITALPATLWARRSLHQLGDQSVTVTEVFLPAILGLAVRN
jgi:chorismate--pyruvate lyase